MRTRDERVTTSSPNGTVLSASDAKSEPIVRCALESALVAGDAAPVVTFGPIVASVQADGRWAVAHASALFKAFNLTTDDAMTLIVLNARVI